MGSGESHLNVLLIVRDKITRQVFTNHNLFEEKGEPKRIRTEVPLLTNCSKAMLGVCFPTELCAREALWPAHTAIWSGTGRLDLWSVTPTRTGRQKHSISKA